MYQYAVFLDNISFSYESSVRNRFSTCETVPEAQIYELEKSAVINNLSLRVMAGEHIGIVGDSGGGKSTLLKILAGLYEPDCGKVVIAGETLPEKIRERVALVMQNNSLFPLSIRDNITCGHAIPEEAVWEACENASLTQWIRSLSDGLDTNVGERGNQVSGGQAQRIQIARALCRNAPIILLDEPVSALDKDTGYSVLNALNKLMEGRTVLHITHHQETLDDSYKVYRMEGGKLIRE